MSNQHASFLLVLHASYSIGFIKSWEINITKKFLNILIFLITLLSKEMSVNITCHYLKISNIYLDSLEDSSKALVSVDVQLLLLVEPYLQKRKCNIWKHFESVWKE